MIGTYSTLGTHRRRGRRRGYWAAFRFLLGVAAVAMVGGYGYQVGVSANQAWTDKLEADLQRFQDDNLGLRDELAQTVLSASRAQTALEDLQQRYQAEVPGGELAALLEQVEAQLRGGVDPERLAFQAAPKRR
jgi:nitrate reductase NapE component